MGAQLDAPGYDHSANELSGVTRKPRCKRVGVIFEIHRVCCRSSQGGYQWRLDAAIRFCVDGFPVANTRGKWLGVAINFILDHPTFGPLARDIQERARFARRGDMFFSDNTMQNELFCEIHQMTLETQVVTSDVEPERISFDAKCVRLTASTADLMGLEKMKLLKPRSQVTLAMASSRIVRHQFVDGKEPKKDSKLDDSSESDSDSGNDSDESRKKKRKKTKRERSPSRERDRKDHARPTVAAPKQVKHPGVTCSNCQGKGHSAKKADKKCDQKGDCPPRRTHLKIPCSLCKGMGHFTSQCVAAV